MSEHRRRGAAAADIAHLNRLINCPVAMDGKNRAPSGRGAVKKQSLAARRGRVDTSTASYAERCLIHSNRTGKHST